MPKAKKRTKRTKSKKSSKSKKSTKKKPTSKDFIASLIKKGNLTRQEIVDKATAKLDLAESTIRTYLTDGKNPKYNPFNSAVQEDKEGKMSFK